MAAAAPAAAAAAADTIYIYILYEILTLYIPVYMI